MICPNCGKDNNDSYRFCAKCGTKLERREFYDLSEMDDMDFDSFENEETMVLDDIAAFENDETVILDDIKAFENDETVMLDDIRAFENDETVMLDDAGAFDNDETVILDEKPAPDFHFRSVYREEQAPLRPVDDMAYIEHLRRLKELLDDGIITEDEFTRKKEQILGI